MTLVLIHSAIAPVTEDPIKESSEEGSCPNSNLQCTGDTIDCLQRRNHLLIVHIREEVHGNR